MARAAAAGERARHRRREAALRERANRRAARRGLSWSPPLSPFPWVLTRECAPVLFRAPSVGAAALPRSARRAQEPSTGAASKHVRHVRLADELEVVCDGLSRRGVIMKPGKPFDVYVAQPDAMMAITAESGGM